MNDLIYIEQTKIGSESVNAVNARDLHKALEVKKAFTTWIVTALDNACAVIDEDYTKLKSSLEGSGYKIDYIITTDMSKHIAMMSKVPKAKEVRDYFISIEKQQNKPLTIEQLLKENMKVISNLENQVIEMKPKALFADSVAQSTNSILIGEFAKLISDETFKICQNKLFAWFRDNNILCSNGSKYNQPCQKYIDNGYFETIERTINNHDGSTRITITTKVTGIGQVKLTSKIKG